MKKAIKVVLNITTVVFFLSSILLLVMGTMAVQQNRYLKIFGHSYSVVGSGSMEPTIKTGEFIVIKYVDYDTVYELVEEGKQPIIAFKTDKNIVHRAIRTENGKIVTKGDNNNSEDSIRVDSTNYVGLITTHFMLLDLGNISLNYKNVVFLIITLLLIGILIHEFISIVKILKLKAETKELQAFEQNKEKWIAEEKERIKKELEEEIKSKYNSNKKL
ncbi:signal peptidase I [Acholeplasma morum]|uniref:signal peptidase I n=1 Tax=Paracholeplasma morum TaxID=264637 RepID=UPI001957E284|nr:signal peptidase I [Paracholeplasma morum]MBM7453319.1 signal peptidase I [Paracholeplasma morum]